MSLPLLCNLNVCVQVYVKYSWKKIVTFNKGLYPETIFPDTEWPFKPDWGEGSVYAEFGLSNGQFLLGCSVCQARFPFSFYMIIESQGSILYAKQALLLALNLCKSICLWRRMQASPLEWKMAREWDKTIPFFVTSWTGTLPLLMQKGPFALIVILYVWSSTLGFFSLWGHSLVL